MSLVRELRRWDLVALVINAVIGAGIFGLPARVFAIAGSFSIVAYLVAAVAALSIVLCFAEVGSRFSETGGPYLYARTTYGPAIGFQVGWLMWFGRVASIASLANLFVGYTTYFLPPAANEPWRSLTIAALLAPLAAVNVLGIRVTRTVTNTFTAAKLIPLSVFALTGLFFVDSARYVFSVPDYGTFSQATLLLIFTFSGFEAATIPTGEMRDPSRHLPFALLTGMGTVALIYVTVQIVAIGTLPELASSQRPLADASRRFLGAPGALLIAVGTLVSITGTQNASLFATPRLLFAMAEQKQLPRMFASIHPRFRTPVASIIVTTAVALLMAIFSSFVSALTVATVVRLAGYAMTCAALPLLRRNPAVPPAAFSVPAGFAVSVLAVILSVWLLSNSPAAEMRISLVALAAGLLAYQGSRRSRRGQTP